MNFSKKIIFTFLFLLYALLGITQEYLFDVQKINVEEGLPKRDVHRILQDSEGYIWVAMQGTLSRFDGHQFKNYDYDFLNIRSNAAIKIIIDNQDRIWYSEEIRPNLAMFAGIFDSKQDSIYTFESISNGLLQSDNINFVNYSDVSNDILVGTRDGKVYRYDGQFHLIYTAQKYKNIWNCYELEKDVYYIIQPYQKLSKIVNGKIIKTTHFSSAIFNFKKINNELFAEVDDKGSRKYQLLSNPNKLLKIPKVSNLEVTGIIHETDDFFLYNTTKGLVIKGKNESILSKYFGYEKPGLGTQLKYNSFFKDIQGILWIATSDGILKIEIKKKPFTILHPNNSIRGIAHIGNRQYIGGYFGNYYANINDDNWKKFFHKTHAAVSYQPDKNGNIWIGSTTRYLYKYQVDTDELTTMAFPDIGEIFFPFINPVTNHFLLGTSEGLYRLNPNNKNVQPITFPIDKKAIASRNIYVNDEGIWLTTTKGLFLLDAKTEKFINYYSKKDGFPTNSFNHLYEDKNGIFWIGTKDKGLIRWNRKNGKIRQFSKKDGLSNNNIYAVYEDDYDGLWLPSDYGLMRFDKASSEVKVYMPNDGIAHEEFNTFAHYQDKEGYLYFGGLKGITKFHPKDFVGKKDFQPNLTISSIKILSNDSEFYEDKTNDFLIQNRISLQSSDRILELQLALLDFANPSENQYAYKILNHNKNWTYLNGNILSINNLSSGNYTLVIKARGAGGNWLDKELSIKIYVAPPFYLTWWFILMVVSIVGLSIWWYFKNRTIQLQQRNLELEKIVKERTKKIEKQTDELKALDKAKTQFFSNITHEFRTPLTLIIGPLQQLLKQTTETTKQQKINSVLNNANQLLALVNQLLDISKLEHNQMQIEVSFGNIVEYTEDILQRFRPLVIQQQKQLNLNISTNSNQTYFDKEKWNKILSNLLSNAIKYTKENGQIDVNLIVDEQQKVLKLTVKDNGIGIEKANLPLIFERFYQTNANRDGQLGTGIGLSLVKELVEVQNGTIEVKSKAGVGSTFFATLPIVETASNLLPNMVENPALQTIPIIAKPTILQKENTTNTNKTSLLIIEDNPEMRLYIRDCIDESIYDITEAINGEEGIAKALKTIPDLIISDVMMPKKDGYEVTQTIRQTVSTSHIPLILLTAKASLESRLEGLQRGADVYLTKPFSSDELVLRIQKLLEIRQLVQQQFANQESLETTNNIEPAYQSENQFIINVRNYILENIEDEKLTVESLAQAFTMSRMQFYRKIKALTNQSASEFIRSVRLNKAAELIKTKELTLSEIAYATGFSSPSAFSKAFKKKFGQSPSSL